jgi:hypothetical protein
LVEATLKTATWPLVKESEAGCVLRVGLWARAPARGSVNTSAMREFKTVLIWGILSGRFLFGWFWKKQLFGSKKAPLIVIIQAN